MLVIIGEVTNEGVECPAMRGEDGVLYTLAIPKTKVRVGDRIEVQGELAMASTCQQGTTLRVQQIKVLKN